MALPSEPSSLVRAFKVLRFPPNKKGEVTDEDFELLRQHGHIGKGRLRIVGGDLYPTEMELDEHESFAQQD